MADKRLVISIFDAETEADQAVVALRNAGAVVDEAVGVMVLDEHGHLKTHKLGKTSGAKGLAAGAALALLGPVGIGVGLVGGGVVGKLHHKSLGLDDGDRERLNAALQGGKAAVGVLVGPQDIVAVESILAARGGDTDRHELDEAAMREAVESA